MKTFKQFILEKKIFGIGPNGIGSWVHDDEHDDSEIIQHPTDKTVGNEPFKNKPYFRRSHIKRYIGAMRRSIGQGKKLPPVSGTPHPENPNVISVLDGNHRRQAFVNARTTTIPIEHISHENIRLMHPDHKELDTMKDTVMQGTPLSHFRKKDGSYDVNKPHEELGGQTLSHYFVRPDGTHGFFK